MQDVGIEICHPVISDASQDVSMCAAGIGTGLPFVSDAEREKSKPVVGIGIRTPFNPDARQPLSSERRSAIEKSFIFAMIIGSE